MKKHFKAFRSLHCQDENPEKLLGQTSFSLLNFDNHFATLRVLTPPDRPFNTFKLGICLSFCSFWAILRGKTTRIKLTFCNPLTLIRYYSLLYIVFLFIFAYNEYRQMILYPKSIKCRHLFPHFTSEGRAWSRKFRFMWRRLKISFNPISPEFSAA